MMSLIKHAKSYLLTLRDILSERSRINKIMSSCDIYSINEIKMRRNFVSAVNDMIAFYNQGPTSYQQYYRNAICSHATTAWVMGWKDLAVKIEGQYKALEAGQRPQAIA